VFKYYFSNTWTGLGCSGVLLCSLGVEIELSPYSYQLICLISQPILITSRYDWYWLKGLFKGFPYPLRPWESSKNWWRYGWMKFVTGYLLICSISWPILIALRCDWYQLKGLFKSFWVPLRLWESLKNWWRYGWMKFVTLCPSFLTQHHHCVIFTVV